MIVVVVVHASCVVVYGLQYVSYGVLYDLCVFYLILRRRQFL